MKSRRLPWIIAVPLMVGGSLSAHALGYLALAHTPSTLAADPDMGEEVVTRASHGLSTLTPVFAGLVVALTIAGYCCYLWSSGRGHQVKGVARAWFFLLPPLAFTAQEFAERLVHAESMPFNPAHEPAFLAALALQIPFGLAAYFIARLLLRVADVLVRALARGRRTYPTSRSALPRLSRPFLGRRSLALLKGHSSRSPPLIAI